MIKLDETIQILRWITRVLNVSLIVVLIYVLIKVSPFYFSTYSPSSAFLFFSCLLVLFGFFFAWVSEGTAGFLMLLSSVIYILFVNNIRSLTYLFLLAGVMGVLLLICRFFSKI